MDFIIWYIIMIPCSALFTGIGLYARRKKTPMHFWSGSTVKPDKIRDVAAYNRANGRMWLGFSLPMWLSTFLMPHCPMAGGILLGLLFILGMAALPVVYNKIYEKYKAERVVPDEKQ